MDRIDTMQAIADDAKPTTHEPHVTRGLILKPGTILPNGSIVILAKIVDQSAKLGSVLAYDGHDASPYRTWIFRLGDLRSTFWGHYFTGEDDALLDYIKRK